jgi:hypothetical protein
VSTTALIITPAGDAALITGPLPVDQNITAGNTVNFTWTYNTTATGTITFSGNAFTGAVASNVTQTSVTSNNPALLSYNSMMILPPLTYSTGQNITVVMTISNTGQTSANNVAPLSALTRIGTAAAVLTSGPNPANTVIPAGGAGSFTWIYNLTGSGNLSYFGQAQGTDASTGATVTSVTGTSNSITVDTPALLSGNISIEATTINLGEALTVIMTVTNNGMATALGVSPSNLIITSGSTGGLFPINGPVPASQDIAGNSTAYFTWTYSASGQGLAALQGNASGTDQNSMLIVSSASNSSNNVNIQIPALLNVYINAVPLSVKTGQAITVYMTVTNSGQETTGNVVTSALTIVPTGGGNVALTSGPNPATLGNLAGGASGEFTWVYNSTAQGGVQFAGYAYGLNVNTGMNTTSTTMTSNPAVQINNASFLVDSITALPATVSTGQLITVALTVTNNGTAATQGNVTPDILVNNFSSITLNPVSVPTPAAALGVGLSDTFTWIYTASSVGSMSFSANAAYTDSVYGAQNTVPVTSGIVQVQTAAVLTSSITSPVSVDTNTQVFTITMLVQNTGGATANGVSPALNITGTAGTGVVPVTVPAPIAIPGGTSYTFTWTFSGFGTGNLVFSGNATGIDNNSGLAVSSAVSLANNNTALQIQPTLLVTTMSAYPPTVATTQMITLYMTVSNAGGALAQSIVPSALTLVHTGTGNALLSTGPLPAAVASLSPGTAVTFTWTYSATAQGNVWFSGSANGIDGNTMGAITSGVTNTPQVSIISAQAILTASLSAAPPTVGFGEMITVYMTVTNTGLYAANGVLPALPLMQNDNPVGSGLTTVNTSPATPVNLNINQSTEFTWVYSANGTVGVVSYSGSATGTDSGPFYGGPEISVPSTTNNVAIQAPATLASNLTVMPMVVNVNQQITLIMTVTNTGGASAVTVNPNQLVKIGTGSSSPANPLAAPVNVTIAPGGSQNFTWIVIATGIGPLAWQGNASGYDINTGAQVSSTNNTTGFINIEQPATLGTPQIVSPSNLSLLTVQLTPVPIFQGQLFTVTMTVTNSGQGTVNNVVPTLSTTGSGSIEVISAPTPVNMIGGAVDTFTWTYSSTSIGNLNLQGWVQGLDVNSGNTIYSNMGSMPNISIKSAASIVSQISVVPATAFSGVAFQVILVVSNTGGVAATDVSPTGIVTNASGAIPPVPSLVSGPSAASITVQPNSSGSFTWIYTASGSGLLTFNTAALGMDANAGWPLATTSTGATITIQSSSALSANISALPATVSTGEQIVILMTITQTGVAGTTAYNVIPFALQTNGMAGVLTGPTTVPLQAQPVTLTTGVAVTYQWTFTSNNAGTVTFSTYATGLDPIRGAIQSVSVLSSPVIVQKAAGLTTTIAGVPAQVDIGSNFTITLTVSNTGDAAVNNLVPVPAASANATLVSGPTPANYATLAGHNTATFVWVYTGLSAGVFSLTTTAQGTDANSGLAVNSPSVTSNVAVQMPAALISTVFTVPANTISQTQVVQVILSVTNTGGATADNVLPTMTLTNGGLVIPMTAPTAQNINGNSSKTFLWTYSCSGIGNVTFNANASGTDANSGAAVNSAVTNAQLIITQPAANLQSQIVFYAPVTPVPLNQEITVVLNITNTGLVAATDVTPQAMVISGTGSVTQVGTVAPASIASIPVNGSASFTWTYNTVNPGTVIFSASAIGSDTGTSLATNSSANSNLVIAPSGANFSISISALPPSVALTQMITIVMTVTNIGQTLAYNVNPDIVTPTVTGIGLATFVTETSADNLTINPYGGTAAFTWVYTAVTGGTLEFNRGLAWSYIDSVSGNTINTQSSLASSNVVTIQFGQPTAIQNDMYLTTNSINPNKNQAVTVIFSVATSAQSASLMVFDIAGTRIRTISLGPVSSGVLYTQLAIWDGKADDGMVVTNGIYYIKLTAGGYSQIKKVAVIKQ